MNGYGLLVVPLSWALGRWDVSADKIVWAFGPFRWIKCTNLGPWKGKNIYGDKLYGG